MNKQGSENFSPRCGVSGFLCRKYKNFGEKIQIFVYLSAEEITIP